MDTVFVILSYGGKKQLAKISEDMWIALDRAWGTGDLFIYKHHMIYNKRRYESNTTN